jgi:hypothetical protein
MTIKAIETVYNGYRFRSRLEARWAVFFDTLGVKYEYEPEGFELPDGERYLPDFKVSKVYSPHYPPASCWIEIKGPMPEHEELLKLRQFVETAKTNMILVIGTPDIPKTMNGDPYGGECDYELWFLGGSLSAYEFDYWMSEDSFWLGSQRIEGVWEHLVHNYLDGSTPIKPPPSKTDWRAVVEADRRYYEDRHGKEHPGYKYGFVEKGVWVDGADGLPIFGDISNKYSIYGYQSENPKCYEALLAARQARFEHGENGRPS